MLLVILGNSAITLNNINIVRYGMNYPNKQQVRLIDEV